MAADPAAHAFADENDWLSLILSRVSQRLPMSRDEQRRGIGPPASSSHVIVIEGHHIAEASEPLFPALHPRM
jgi:hypothetical protein